MDKPEQRFKINTRVRLRGGVDPNFFEGLGRVGNEGWIRRRKRDRYGYPEVLIEWDRDHWAYNGQPDCWTMEGQFEAVEENEVSQAPEPNQSRDEKVRGLTEQFINALFGALGVDEETPSPPPEEIPEEEQEDDSDQWEALAAAAADAVQHAPAYVVIALEHIQADGAPPMIIPRVFHAAREPDYKLITQSHLAHVLASMQDESIAETLQQRAGNDSED